jgi:hypothetical protein
MKKSYTNFVLCFGSDQYIVKSIMVKNDLKIPDAFKDEPEFLQAKADLDQVLCVLQKGSKIIYQLFSQSSHQVFRQAGLNTSHTHGQESVSRQFPYSLRKLECTCGVPDTSMHNCTLIPKAHTKQTLL